MFTFLLILILLISLKLGNSNIEMDNINFNSVITNLEDKYNNKDIVGVLKINNTNFEVPIVQGVNNSYYLNHDLNNKQSNIGSVFLDYRVNIDTSHKLLIYGHSSSDIDASFNILENYYDLNYYKNHRYIELTTDIGKYLYEIFSVYIETDDFSYMDLDFIDEKDFLMHIKRLQVKSFYDNEISLEDLDKILILQTCSHHEDYVNYEKKYLLIISRRIK